VRVYNLTKGHINYKGREIPPNGGFLDYPTLTFVPDRDRNLEVMRILAFGSLPAWWAPSQATTVAVPLPPANVPDKNGNSFSPEALESMSKQIEEKGFKTVKSKK
jgi:hypothetical protein